MATCEKCAHYGMCAEHGKLMLTVDSNNELIYQHGVENSCESFKVRLPKQICKTCGREYFAYFSNRSVYCTSECARKAKQIRNKKNKISTRKPRMPLISESELARLYIVEMMSVEEIGKRFGVTGCTVYRYLKKYQISLRGHEKKFDFSGLDRREAKKIYKRVQYGYCEDIDICLNCEREECSGECDLLIEKYIQK